MVEHACSIPTLLMGEHLQTVSTDMDTYSLRQPLGVVAGICPYASPIVLARTYRAMLIQPGPGMGRRMGRRGRQVQLSGHDSALGTHPAALLLLDPFDAH